MAVNVPGVKLENDFAVLDDLFVFISAMAALATKQLLVPTAAALHFAHGNQRLSFHADLVRAMPTLRIVAAGKSGNFRHVPAHHSGLIPAALITGNSRAS